MNWRWLFLDFVPPELPLDRKARHEVRRRVSKLMQTPQIKNLYRYERSEVFFRKWWMLLITALPYLIINMGGLWLLATGSLRNQRGIWFLAPLWFVASMMALWVHFVMTRRLHYRPFVLHALMERGYEYCLGCGYPLHGLSDSTPRCPECGNERVRERLLRRDESTSDPRSDGI